MNNDPIISSIPLLTTIKLLTFQRNASSPAVMQRLRRSDKLDHAANTVKPWEHNMQDTNQKNSICRVSKPEITHLSSLFLWAAAKRHARKLALKC
jgi:hypothetical protein